MTRRSRYEWLAAFTLTFAATACDDATALDEDQPPDDLAVASSDACPAGMHLDVTDPAALEFADDVPTICVADEVCTPDACDHGTCIEEGGRAVCACDPGYEAADGTCTTTEGPGELAFADSAQTARAQYGEPCIGTDCAVEIPMTGNVSRAFEELDIAMRQFMKWRCVGAGILAVSRNGRRVYKRGFGRMLGPAADGLAGCDSWPQANPDYVDPDTPIPVGSVSKIVTAMMVRELIQQRIEDRGLDNNPAYDDIGGIKLVDPNLDLLPQKWLDLMTGVTCPAATMHVAGQCTPQACAGGYDVRWNDVTIADLVSHHSGWNIHSAKDYDETVVPNLPALRGYTSESQWQAEHDALAARFPLFATSLATRRSLLSSVNGNPVYFVNQYDVLDGEAPMDEYGALLLSRCLDADPAQSTDASPATTDLEYSNTNYTILERVVAHLSTSGRVAAEIGFPAQHTGSQIDMFLEQNGIEEGVDSAGIYRLQGAQWLPGYVDPAPVLRDWKSQTYYPTGTDIKRPWCEWTNGTCKFGDWLSGARTTWNFSFAELPFWATKHQLNIGHGAFVMEAPVLLSLIDKYAVGNNDVLQGRVRAACGSKCNRFMTKDGSFSGGHAYAISSVLGGARTVRLPTQSFGRLTQTGPKINYQLMMPADVDAVVAVNQNSDGNPIKDQDNLDWDWDSLDNFVNFGLSKVDWDLVDLQVDAQARRVAGIAMTTTGNTYYWYENDIRKFGTGTLEDHYFTGPGSAAAYSLPSTRIGVDIVASGISNLNTTFTWYSDGKVSAGSSWDLDSALTPYAYSLPPGQTYDDLLGVEIASNNYVYSWYRNGQRAWGNSADLDAHGTGTYTLPPGQAPEDVIDMAIDTGGTGRVWTLYKDGSISEGWSAKLDAYGYSRGKVVDIEMDDDGDTHLWYANGYHKELQGTLEDNLTSQEVLSSDDFFLPATRDPDEVAGITMLGGVARSYYWATPLQSTYGTPEQMQSGPASYTANGKFASSIRGTALASTGVVYTWFADNTRGTGTTTNLVAGGTPIPFSAPQSALNIVGIAINHAGDNHVWVLYADGAVSEGSSTNLAHHNYWPAPAL